MPNYSNSHTRTPHSPHYSHYRRKSKRGHRTTLVQFQKTSPKSHFEIFGNPDVVFPISICITCVMLVRFGIHDTRTHALRWHKAKPRPVIRIRLRSRIIRIRIHEPRIRPTMRNTAEKASAFRRSTFGNTGIKVIAEIRC